MDGLKVICSVVNLDESVYRRDVESLSLRGAQREVAGFWIGNGFKPERDWVVEAVDGSGVAAETWRRFNPPDGGQ
jgi:hypothetical protein